MLIIIFARAASGPRPKPVKSNQYSQPSGISSRYMFVLYSQQCLSVSVDPFHFPFYIFAPIYYLPNMCLVSHPSHPLRFAFPNDNR
jgi:hypothetical protein